MENTAIQYNAEKYPNFKEYLWFKAHEDTLMRRYYGRFIIIKDEQVWGDYGTWRMAWIQARKLHAPGSYIIQHCIDRDPRWVPRLIGHKFTFVQEL